MAKTKVTKKEPIRLDKKKRFNSQKEMNRISNL